MTARHTLFVVFLISIFALILTTCVPSTESLSPQKTADNEAENPTPSPLPSTPTYAQEIEKAIPEQTSDVSRYLIGEPIPFFEAGQPFTISYIGQEGWAIGSVEGESDHIFRRVSLDLWTDVTPPEPAPSSGTPLKHAAGFFLVKEQAWVAYTTVPGSGQTHVVIWRMVDRFPHVSWAPAVIETRGGIAGADLYFLDENNGWLLVYFEEGGMNKQYIALYATNDGGVTWEFLFDPMEGSEIQSCGKTGIVFENPQRGWVTRACKGLYDTVFIDRTTSSGSTWEKVNLPAPASDPDLFSGEGYCDLFSPHFFPPDELVFVVDCLTQYQPATHAVYLYATRDDGFSWTMLLIPDKNIHFVTRFIAYIIDREIFKTENGGVDWMRLRAVNWDGQFNFTNENKAAAVVRRLDEIGYVETYDGLATFFQGDPSVHPSQDPREDGW